MHLMRHASSFGVVAAAGFEMQRTKLPVIVFFARHARNERQSFLGPRAAESRARSPGGTGGTLTTSRSLSADAKTGKGNISVDRTSYERRVGGALTVINSCAFASAVG